MTGASSLGRVLRFPLAPQAPWRSVVQAERVKARPRFGVGSGMWRLTLVCEHQVMPLKLVQNIAEAAPPTVVQCWKCLAHGVPVPAS